MVRKTKKIARSTQSSGMTIPELRRAFEHIDRFVDTKLKTLKGEDSARAFRKEWKKVFGKDVSQEAAKDYLQFLATSTGSKGSKKQEGGGPAPLLYDMRAGTDIPYGAFPKYVGAGWGFANQDSLLASCGKANGFPTSTPVGLGSNAFSAKGGGKKRQTRKRQGGGGLGNALMEAITRPFAVSTVPSAATDAQMLVKGTAGLASPRPELNDLEFTQKPTLYSLSQPNRLI